MNKKFLYLPIVSITSCLIIIILLELASAAIIPKIKPRLQKEILLSNLKKDDLQLKYDVQTQSTQDNIDWMSADLLHPYLGFVNSEKDGLYGFLGMDTLPKKKEDELVVGIFGGSVAYHFSQEYIKEIEDGLIKIDAGKFKGKKLRIVTVSIGGYKQPQQLLALSYLLSIGAEFDVVINIDGFNDVALPYSDNYRYGITPYYPRLWNLYSQKRLNERILPLIGQLANLNEQKTNIIKALNYPIIENSYLLLILKNILANQITQKQIFLNQILTEELTNLEESAQTQGPEKNMEKTALFLRAAEVWADSSLQMALLAKGNNIEYYHLLQPNQYVVDSKVLTDTEKEIAHIDYVKNPEDYSYAFKYKEAVEIGYPLLVKASEKLKNNGVAFYDTTNLFTDVKEQIYIDECCHYNSKGYKILADYITNILKNKK